MVSFTDVFIRLEEMGLTDVLIPFILIFAIVYAILGMIKIFGDKKNIYMIVALSMALLVVVPHVTNSYPPGQDVVEIINTSIPNVSVVMIAIVMMLILLGVFGVSLNLGNDTEGAWKGAIAFICFGIVFFIFGRSAGWFDFGLPSFLDFLNDTDTMAVIIVVLMFGLIVWFITDDGNSSGKFKQSTGDFFKGLGKLIGPYNKT